ncbi:MAG: 30S ribosomal protein S6 [Treponemataceae bacterium]|nr:30S ribosomal protein S6 [Treponemataceae bacterium]
MRNYELMTIFPLDEEKSAKGRDAVRDTLTSFGAEIEKEELFGDRDLTYAVKKQKRGRFILFTIKLNPGKIIEIDKAFKIQPELLKYLFVKLEEK